MALEGEIDVVKNCPDCGKAMPIRVCMSGAGYYIGQYCDQCGPYNRLSYYYRTRKEAQQELDANTWKHRDTKFHPGDFKVIKLEELKEEH